MQDSNERVAVTGNKDLSMIFKSVGADVHETMSDEQKNKYPLVINIDAKGGLSFQWAK